ncbi:hypothetical protein M409DRAFT_33925, partial [Zasmidium cellare ATCC 36951]
CMDKSKSAVVAMLAILRAGGAVVPLGVQHPLARLEVIVQDTATPLLLVDRGHEKRLTGLAVHVPLLPVDAFFDDTSAASTGMPNLSNELCVSVRPQNVAWVIYTSGSTGKPKGVVLEHGSLATSILAHGPIFGLSSSTRTLQFAALTFDVSISDLVATLAYGGCIVVPSEDDRLSNLNHMMNTFRVTYANVTPTVARLLDPAQLPLLNTLVLIGEAVDAGVVDPWVKRARVINGYGPAEASIVFHCSPPIQRSETAGNVGKPIAGCGWVVDPNNIDRLLPLGAPGELLLEGPLLSRGYLNDPTKTAAAFISDPVFVQELGLCPSRRMYRTGDIVQQNADGSLTYLGRRDTQVKIRGQRVEIGEIESQILRLLPEVCETVVDVVLPAGETQEGALMLTAVIEYADAGPYPDGGELQPYEPSQITAAARTALERLDSELSQVLPAYMVPGAFLLVPRLPVNASNKLDRRAVRDQLRLLPRTVLNCFATSPAIKQAPTTEMERQLRSLWATLLAVPIESIGANDSFFRLGGDSVAAMKLSAKARAQQIPLSVADIF